MWIQAVTFYFYQFIIRVATGNLKEPLTIEFNLSASQYGLFASYWLISYALLQVPVGIALDKWGSRKIFSLSALLCGVGTLIMSCTESFSWLCFSRLLIGAGSASGFIGTFKISSEWFDAKRLPLLVGSISAIGVLGASLAGAPMVVLQQSVGWRAIFFGLSLTAFVLSIVYMLVLRDKKLPSHISLKEIKQQILHLVTEPQIWLLGFVGFLLYTPVSVLAEVWGPAFMKQVYGFSSIESAFASSFIFYGNAFGSFFAGWVFSKFISNKRFFSLFMFLATFSMAVVIWVKLSGFWMLCCGLFFVGSMVGAENMVFPLGARYVEQSFQGLSASIINLLVMVGAIALQPGIGFVMDYLWEGHMEGGFPVYTIEQYKWGLSALIVSMILGIVLSLFVKGKTKGGK
ncbi:MAG: MFS transporter [Candidatus Paracaedibacteraceae bacterium]|nr:MFS transporter [Candidatus Paracaedibacteraceae bacterium]